MKYDTMHVHDDARKVLNEIHIALGEDPESDDYEVPKIVAELRMVAKMRSDQLDDAMAEINRLRDKVSDLERKLHETKTKVQASLQPH